MASVADCHDRAFRFVRDSNVPEPGVVLREVAVGFRRLGMDPEDCRVDCNLPQIKDLINSNPRLGKPLIAMCERGLVDQHWYRGLCQEDLSSKYGFGKANRVKFIDLLILGEDNTWVVEVKPKLNYEALGQVLVLKDLLEEDHPELGRTQMAILVCKESDPLIEETCRKHNIRIITLR